MNDTVFRLFSEIGFDLADKWGIKGPSNQQISREDEIVCVLCAILKRLGQINSCLDRLKPGPEPNLKPGHPVSDGMFKALTLAGDELIWTDGTLSIRARRALINIGAKYWGQVTREKLEDTRNCGPVTINELLDRKAKALSKETPEVSDV